MTSLSAFNGYFLICDAGSEHIPSGHAQWKENKVVIQGMPDNDSKNCSLYTDHFVLAELGYYGLAHIPYFELFFFLESVYFSSVSFAKFK